MFGTLGGPELLLILVLALIVFGPRKLPDVGRSLGRMMAEFRKASNDFRRTLEDEVEAEKLPPPTLPSSFAGSEPRPDTYPAILPTEPPSAEPSAETAAATAPASEPPADPLEPGPVPRTGH